MINKTIIFTFFFLFLGKGLGFAACESSLNISVLPPDNPMIKSDLSDLQDYFTCKAAVTGDIEQCNVFPEGSSPKADCRDVYNRYYRTFGELYKNGRLSGEGLQTCLKKFGSKNACYQFGEVLLSGNASDCEKIEGITPENLNVCLSMVSSDPFGSSRAMFMMVLRKGDRSLCDQIDNSPVAAVCRGILNKKVDGCQLNAGVDHFKKLYCQHQTT